VEKRQADEDISRHDKKTTPEWNWT